MLIMGDFNAHTRILQLRNQRKRQAPQRTLQKRSTTHGTLPRTHLWTGETTTAIDYILLDRERANDLGRTTILNRELIYSDHNILQAEVANENPLPKGIETQKQEPAMRLKNPVAKAAYHKILKARWAELKNTPFQTLEDRYTCYSNTIKEALRQVQKIPNTPPKVVRIIKLKQELTLAHWQYKTLSTKGRRQAEIAKELRDSKRK